LKIIIYVEGGGNRKDLKGDCRRSFGKFFAKTGLTGRLPQVRPCGGRSTAFKDFCTALNNPINGELPILLVDSEDPLITTVWQHVKNRQGDQWDKPQTATDDHLHLMVQCMETWYMADKEALAEYFGQGFNSNALPRNQNIENIPKDDLFNKLKSATRNTTKGQYNKGSHSFKILERLDPDKVREASPFAQRLLNFLDENCQ